MTEGLIVVSDEQPQTQAADKKEKTKEEEEQEQAARRNEAIKQKASELLKNNCNPAPDMTMFVHIGENEDIDREVFGCDKQNDMSDVIDGVLIMDMAEEGTLDFSGAEQDPGK